jgi:hypothetical protein
MEQVKVGRIVNSSGRYHLELDRRRLHKVVSLRDATNLVECESCPVKRGGGCAKESLDYYRDLRH